MFSMEREPVGPSLLEEHMELKQELAQFKTEV